ncbi:tetratricopeptide repeat protein [Phenylobacterium aquaticum]|uniref:tetratricopeptide repeat protein n=1 Tax=Phenylobacterium aquaticum TaxID=1763816 RepID=UPI001F5D6FDD|nr:tetratricopeptide repeat protein [Phenylobacterium aquaticum]MCI3132587.1 tetratricopeptide repeat protein [Phenylobacterium aquaticum]
MTRAPAFAALTLLLAPLPALAGSAAETCAKAEEPATARLTACAALLQDAALPTADKVAVLNIRSSLMLDLDRPKDAIAEANAALALAPGNALALNLRAEAEQNLGQFPAALADVRAALAADPRSIRTLLNLGAILRASGAPPEAERDAYDKALAIAPDNPYALAVRAG